MSTSEKNIDGYISYALAAAHRAVQQSLSARLKKHGLQIEAWRVMELLDSDDRLTMGELARRGLINPPTLSKLVDRMVSNGLVHRQVSLKDQRQVNLLLTDYGRNTMLKVRGEVADQDRQIAGMLDEQDSQNLVRMLSALVQ